MRMRLDTEKTMFDFGKMRLEFLRMKLEWLGFELDYFCLTFGAAGMDLEF